jgi:hypothetical protein
VAASAGSGIALQSLSITPDGQVSLGGQASGPFYIQRFALDLGQGESLRKPFIETLKQDDKGQFTFRIGARFREQAPAVTADAKSEQKGGE